MLDLKMIIQKYPRNTGTRTQLASLLHDLYPSEKREVNLALAVYDCGITSRIAELKNIDSVQLRSFVKQLVDEYGLQEQYAIEGVEIWAKAYSVSVPMEGAINDYHASNEGKQDKHGSNKKSKHTRGEVVWYDKDGLYIAYRGINHYSESSWIIGVYVDNCSGEDIYVSLDNGRANRFSISFANSFTCVLNDSIYLAGPKFDFIINVDDLKQYGITTLERLDFTLRLSKSWLISDTVTELPITIAMNEPVA